MASTKEINLALLLKMLKMHKKYIFGTSGVTTLIAIVYCLFATPIFTASALIAPPKLTDAGVGLSRLLSGSAIAIGGRGFFSQRTDADTAMALLSTDQLQDMVIKKFNLTKYYKKKNNELTRRVLNHVVQFLPDIKSGFLEIDVSDKDPKFAAAMANYYTVALGQLISNIAYNKSKAKQEFFQEQIKTTKMHLVNAQNKLKQFAKEHGISAGQQVKMVSRLTMQLQAQLVVAQARLQSMSLYATSTNPDYIKQKSVIASLQKQLNAISGQSDSHSNDKLPVPPGLAPDLAAQYTNLMGEIILNQEVLKVLYKQHEAASIDVLSEAAPTVVQVIDPAQVPLYKSKPKRLKIVLLGFILGVMASTVYFLLRNYKEYISDFSSRNI